MFNIYYHNNLDGDKTSSREESNIFCWKEVTHKFLKNILNSDFGKKRAEIHQRMFSRNKTGRYEYHRVRNNNTIGIIVLRNNTIRKKGSTIRK